MSNPNDMYIDTDNFDFFSLNDVVLDVDTNGNEIPNSDATAKHNPSKVAEGAGNPDGGIIDDTSDLSFDFGEEDEVEESDEVEEAVEEVEEEVEDSEVEQTETPDEQEVDFEEYEITLPTGENVVLSEVIKGYKDNQALEQAIAEFNQTQEAFVKESEGVYKHLELARLEADRVIEDYEDFDWATYKREDPAGYVENREFLDRYIARRKEIIDTMQHLESQKAEAEAATKQKAAEEAAAVLQRDIPGWSKDLYVELMEFAIAQGAEKDYIENCIDPLTFKLLHKALQFEKGKKTVVAKMKRVGSPTKVVQAQAKPTPTEQKVDKKK
ncbi:UNVERIFIED_CONTAM: hypothetical protein RF648_18110, partial [Kocuria sp. CPCC 205274]